MVTRMFFKMMIYLTIGVVSVNYLIDSHMEFLSYLQPDFQRVTDVSQFNNMLADHELLLHKGD